MLAVARGLDVFAIDQFYQSLYQPDLLRESLARDPNGKVGAAAAKLDLAKAVDSGRVPSVRITSHKSENLSATDNVILEAHLGDLGGGIGRAEWRVNGITVGIVANPMNVLQQKVGLDRGDNIIELVAYNGQNLVSSIPARASISWDSPRRSCRAAAAACARHRHQ